MEPLTNAETALLGLLCEGEAHPYQLEKKVECRSMRDWTDLSMSAIYQLLRKLEQKLLVSSRTEIAEGNKTRKIYQVTAEGRKILRSKLKQLLGEPEPVKWRFDIAIHNLHLLPKKEAIAALENYKQGLKKGLDCYRALKPYLENEKCPPHRQALAVRPQYLLEAELKWVEAFMREME